MNKLFTVLLLVLLSSTLMLSQEKWSQDPRMISKPQGIYTPLPTGVANYVNPNTTASEYNTLAGLLLVNPNIRVYPTTSNQEDEVILVRHPLNQNIMLGSANTTVGSSYSQGVYVTTNGGVNWFGSDILATSPTTPYSDPGPTIDKNGVFIMTTLLLTGSTPMVACYSTNNGLNWSSLYTISSLSSDKNFASTDDASSSPYYGRSYCVWSNFAASLPPAVISYTTNSGASWSSMSQINTPPSGHYSQGVDIRVGPTGQVYVVWAAPMSSSPYTEDFAGFARSTNGGVSWVVTENAYDMNGIRGYLFPTNIRVNGFPRIDVDRSGGPRNGWIYVVTAEKNLAPAGSDPDVIMHRSTDGGTTWSAGIRVNQDALNNGKIQFFPAIRVDEYGGINVVYYDNRNCASDSSEVFVSRSIDGGSTWSDIVVSDHRFKPKPEPGFAGYMGDYIGITSGNNKVWPFWMDDITGNFQAWTTTIDLGPSITHTPLSNTENLNGPYIVNCVINPAGSPIDPSKTRVLWSRNNPSITDSVLMTNTSGNNWTANIPGNGSPATYRYYIKTADLLNRIATHPSGAPAVLHLFTAMSDTAKPVITHTPLGDIPKPSWPATVNAAVTDNIGLDSVWVRWYKNNPGTGLKQFKLINIGGNNFSAAFNSDTSQVAYNDSIFYRIIAQDNSTNHNKDSTALYKFKIIAVVTACIGTGTTSVGYPYYTFYMDSRTDMLYYASEIIAGGGASGNITRIGFNVISAASQTMNGFKIKMQHTTATTITTFTSSGWTTVYSGTYSVPGTGWQFVDLQTPFQWNGTQNLLVEICFNNNSYTSNSNVYATPASGRLRHQHADLSSGDGCTDLVSPSSSYTALPNVCLTINLLVGNNSQQTVIPKVYSLAQNYPNPFNPATSIRFSLPKSGHVKLVVYDAIGREVAILVNDELKAGEYNQTFDGSNLSSGVYFYRINAGEFTDVKKMVLVK